MSSKPTNGGNLATYIKVFFYILQVNEKDNSEKWAKIINRQFTEKDIQIALKHIWDNHQKAWDTLY